MTETGSPTGQKEALLTVVVTIENGRLRCTSTGHGEDIGAEKLAQAFGMLLGRMQRRACQVGHDLAATDPNLGAAFIAAVGLYHRQYFEQDDQCGKTIVAVGDRR